MSRFRSVRWLGLALFVILIPVSSFAGVFISVGIAPPPLPVYDQPPCPDPGLMWTPGYWAYGPDGYYWVPGAWVPAPYVGALWTPGYWGWANNFYMWNPGYWGRHVGYYGGINYGFGYGGIGFVGGMWRGNTFAYNTAIMHINRDRIHNVYEDRAIIGRNTVARDSRVAFSGGRGGIDHPMSAQERSFANERHTAPTSFQNQHSQAAQNDRSSYFKSNNGRPSNAAAARPLAAENHQAPTARPGAISSRPTGANNTFRQSPAQQNRPAMQQSRPEAQQRPQQMQQRPQVQQRQVEQRPQMQQQRPQAQQRQAPQQHEQAQQRSGGESHERK